MTGNTSNSVSAPANQTALNQAAQQVSAHKGDLEWITSATGQAAIAALQQQAMAQVSIPASRAAPGQVAATFSNLRLPWVIQSMAPVYDDPLKIENGGIDIELNVSVRLLETN
jgi:hypothetical protein